MSDNIFLKENKKQMFLEEYMNYNVGDRENLGSQLPVAVYRLMEYSLKEELTERFGTEEQIRIFRDAGYRAGVYFAKHFLDTSLEQNVFLASLQSKMEELKIGVLRMEYFDEEAGKIVLTVSEDADCSGLPLLGETVCNYDEGFLAGILSSYFKKDYVVVETDCWATGDRVCRFCARQQSDGSEQ